jgi:ferritin
MMQVVSTIVLIVSFCSLAQSTITAASPTVGQCLSELITQQLTVSYNYLQLASKFGTTSAYPGFSSLFTKLSDEHSEKGHDLTKLLALRKFKVDRLISKDGINIRKGLTSTFDIRQGLTEARNDNKENWKKVLTCHQEADNAKDPHTQDYLEANLLNHHVEIDKLLSDLEHRIDDAQPSEKKLLTYMVDEELLQTYGDRRKDVFS